MKRSKLGFTLVEISIFLALSALLFAGTVIALSNSVGQQRFYDATQNFADFLRNVYAEVSNPQSLDYDANTNLGGGRSNFAIYGKLIVFGENTGLTGAAVNTQNSLEGQKIYVYDVIGDVVGTLSGNVKDALKNANANVLIGNCETRPSGIVTCKDIGLAGPVEEYTVRWGAAVENPNGSGFENRFTGSVLIVRHPSSGMLNTLFSETIVKANQEALTLRGQIKDAIPSLIPIDSFKTDEEINFCVNSNGEIVNSGKRQNIRITKNAHSAADVILIDLDGANNACNK